MSKLNRHFANIYLSNKMSGPRLGLVPSLHSFAAAKPVILVTGAGGSRSLKLGLNAEIVCVQSKSGKLSRDRTSKMSAIGPLVLFFRIILKT